MKTNFHFFNLIIATIFFCYIVSCGTNSNIKELPDGMRINTDSGDLDVRFYNEKVVRVTFLPTGSIEATQNLMIDEKNGYGAKIEKFRKDGIVTLKTSLIQVKIELKSNRISILDSSSNLLLSENQRHFGKIKVLNDSGYSIRQDFIWKPSEALYGLGQQQEGIMNWRGHSVVLYQKNKYIAMPVLLSSEGYGLLWNNYSLSKFNDLNGASYFSSELADKIDYYFIYGPKPDSVISGLRLLTGQAPMFPKWAFGYIQSKERYKNQDEIINVVKEYRKRHIPLDCIVLDWQYWTGSQWGQKSFDSVRFSSPELMMKRLHEDLNAHLMISIWPKMGVTASDFKEMKQHPGFLYTENEKESVYDAFNPEARNLYWDQANRGIFSKGVDAWWCDATEPELKGWDWQADNFRKIMKPAIGTGTRYMNAYPLMQSKGIYENQRKTTIGKRVFILTRSAFPGLQRYGASCWSGDIDGNWKVYKDQIAAGLNFCMSGIPYWTTDIGGFFIYGIKNFKMERTDPPFITDKNFKKLYVRWYQFGCFSPLFRTHGTDLPREAWRFGETGTWAYDAIVETNLLRYRLLPYIYSNARKVTSQGYTLMRGLIFDFPADKEIFNIGDQYMFGPSILVNPVTDSIATTRKLYLPKSGWYDFWTGDFIQGGKWIIADAPISKIPLYIKAGSILPFGPAIQYATENIGKLIEIRVYKGADGIFELYEDENDNYNYEKGQFSIIPFIWNDKEKLLTIRVIQGGFPGMIKQRTFHIVCVKKNSGIGIMDSKSFENVQYEGKEIVLKLEEN